MSRRIAWFIGVLALSTLTGCGMPRASLGEPAPIASVPPVAASAPMSPTATIAAHTETAVAGHPTMYFVESPT